MEVYNIQPARVDIRVTKVYDTRPAQAQTIVYDTRSAQAQTIKVQVFGELYAQGSVLKAVIRNEDNRIRAITWVKTI